MKNASPALIAFLASKRNFIMADLWEFNLKNGVNLFYTSWDVDLALGPQMFKSHDVLVTGGKIKQSRGLEVNETDVTCYPSLGATTPASMVGNLPFLIAVKSGLLDRATVTRQRVFMPTPGDTSLGAVTLFIGEVTDSENTRNTSILKCKDATNLLNIYMPPRQYQPTCAWTFGDSRCTVNKALITVNSSVAPGSAGTLIYAALTQIAGYFNYGSVSFTSGVNAGVSRSIKNYTKGIVTLTGPFPAQPQPGDTFQITPGCSKNFAGTVTSFNGAVNSGISPSFLTNNLGNTAGSFNGYTLKFTSGPLIGLSNVISSWTPELAIMMAPFNQSPNVGDAFEILPPGGGNASAFGQIINTLTQNVIPIGLSMSDGFFNGGTLQFTSGANVGQTQTITSWASGVAIVQNGFGAVPAIGDQCMLSTAISGSQSTCTTYNNTINFGGQDLIPVPETAY